MRVRPVRWFPALLALIVSVGLLAACSTGPDRSEATDDSPAHGGRTKPDPDAFPVTIEHALGSTTIKHEPKRVATLGWGDQDDALALGVVPVGATKLTWGGNKQGSSSWFDQKLAELDGKAPTRYDDSDGAPVADIAKLDPDVILATNSGVTKTEYKKLSKIAPVVVYPDDPWTTPWQKSLTMVGKALGRSQAAEKLADETGEKIKKARKQYPQLAGRTVIFGYLTATDLSTIGIYSSKDPRVALMHDLGMVDAPAVKDVVQPGKFYDTVSAERAASLKSDVFLTWSEHSGDMKKFAKNDLIGKIPAVKNGHVYAEEDDRVSMAVTNPTPLSIPYVLKHFVPEVAKAVDGA